MRNGIMCSLILCSNTGIQKWKRPGSAANMLANAGHSTSDGKLLVGQACRVDSTSHEVLRPSSLENDSKN